jgi:hypothetical protein
MPGLILALKKAVGENLRPGRFLITGCVDLFKGKISPDSLAGRAETLERLPFSQSEISRRSAPAFLKNAFWGDVPALEETARIVIGEPPELIVVQGHDACVSECSNNTGFGMTRDGFGRFWLVWHWDRSNWEWWSV